MVAEARKYGVYLILTLVNNWDDYGGKKQYVQWARDGGQSLNNNDDFFTNPVVKGYFKNHVKVYIYRLITIVFLLFLFLFFTLPSSQQLI